MKHRIQSFEMAVVRTEKRMERLSELLSKIGKNHINELSALERKMIAAQLYMHGDSATPHEKRVPTLMQSWVEDNSPNNTPSA